MKVLKNIIKECLFLIYDLIFLTVIILYLPVYFFKGKITAEGLKQKFGFIHLSLQSSVWLHAVSVGEVMLIEELAGQISESMKLPLVISVTTLTGYELACKKYSGKAKIFYFPFDITAILLKAIKSINPKILIVAETEIWPNLFRLLNEKNIPVVLVNGRISDKAYKRYMKVKWFIRYSLNKIAALGVQNEDYKDRFISLGCKPNRLFVTGNMKFCTARNLTLSDDFKTKYAGILGVHDKSFIVAGSTHQGEEEILLKVYKRLKDNNRKIKMLIAPRHVNRINDILNVSASLGLIPKLISELSMNVSADADLFFLDTIGELSKFYGFCDICFVGGSIVPYGGHNILEPLAYNKPVIFGSNMRNFQDIAEAALSSGAGISVEDEATLYEAIECLLTDSLRYTQLCENARKVFEKGAESSKKNLELIKSVI